MTGSKVTASDGAILAGFTADVEFDVVDNAGALIAEMGVQMTQQVISQRRIRLRLIMMVGDRVVNASDGAILAGFTADVEFDVVDTANLVAAEVAGSG